MLQYLKNNKKTAFAALVLALAVSAAAIFNIHTQYQWGKRVKTWKTISAELCYNSGNKAGYRYVVGKKYYLGREVTYGFSIPGDKKKGQEILCIIDPGNPGESAALIEATGLMDHLRRFLTAVICIPLSLLFLAIFFIGITKRNPDHA